MLENVVETLKKIPAKGKKIRRHYSKTPEYAYTPNHWCQWFKDTDKLLNVNRDKSTTLQFSTQIITNKIYPVYFIELKWTPQEFKLFVETLMQRSISQGRNPIGIYSFWHKEKGLKTLAEKFHENEVLYSRKFSFLKKTSYLEYIPITIEEDLENIFKNIQIKPIAFMFNYGFQIYFKYLMMTNNLTTKETESKIKEEIKSFMKNNPSENTLKIIQQIMKTSILVEPCSDTKNEKIFNWRIAFEKFLQKTRFIEEQWYQPLVNENLHPIKSIKKFILQ